MERMSNGWVDCRFVFDDLFARNKDLIESMKQEASNRQIGGTYYKDMPVQPWDVVDGWSVDEQIAVYRHGALKYLMRMGTKDERIQEIEKAKHYIEKLLEVLYDNASK